jgi:hypothetical protein
MPGRDWHRVRPLERRRAFQDPLPLILVVCEGKITEPQYIEGFRASHGTTTVQVKVHSPGGDPKALVERAIELRDDASGRARREGDDNLMYDEVWCVFDVDTHERFEAARAKAQAEAIRLAVSNPCFELWLLIHFVAHNAHVSADQARRLLRKHVPNYNKHVHFDEFATGYPAAVERARALEARHMELGQDCGNPSTGAYRLTERIREFGKEARLNG